MTEQTKCDWCLRPLAPDGVSWDNVDDPEGYCWGDEQQGCACDDAHEEAWPKMLSEVARLREQVAEARRMAGEQLERALTAETLEAKLRDQAVVNGYTWTYFVEKIRKPLAGVRKYDSLGDPYYPDDLEIQLLVERYEKERATSARLRGLLGDMEYVHFPNGLSSLCPACYLTPGMGHSVDCRLAAALAAERRTDHG